MRFLPILILCIHAHSAWKSQNEQFNHSDCLVLNWQKDAHKPVQDLVLWFHGGMNSAQTQKGLGAALPLSQNWHPKQNTLLISCSAWGQRNWLHPETIASLDQCLDRHLGSARLRLIGISDGSLGVLAYQILGKYSARSATLISSFPGLILRPADLNHPKLQKPQWTFIQGGQDRLYPLSDWQKWMQLWTQALPKSKLLIDPQGVHDFSYWSSNHPDWIFKSLQ